MPETPMQRLANYLQGVADSFETSRRTSTVFANRSDAGTVREDIIKDFLDRHLPSRCQVIKGGYIFDAENRESKQIDLIVVNDLTIQFRQHEKAFSCIEGCYCAISVKTRLDKADLFDCLDNLASIPPMPDLSTAISPLVSNKSEFNNLPACAIFAYEGVELPTIGTHLKDYYDQNPDIPLNRRPDIVIVNNKYFLVKSGPDGGSYRDSTPVPPNQLIPMYHPQIGGFALLFLLNTLQKIASIASQISLNSDHYVNNYPLS